MNAGMSLGGPWWTLHGDQVKSDHRVLWNRATESQPLWYRCKWQHWGTTAQKSPATPLLSISHFWLLHAGGTGERGRKGEGLDSYSVKDWWYFTGGEKTRSDYNNRPSFSGIDGWLGVFSSGTTTQSFQQQLCEDIKCSQKLLLGLFLPPPPPLVNGIRLSCWRISLLKVMCQCISSLIHILGKNS